MILPQNEAARDSFRTDAHFRPTHLIGPDTVNTAPLETLDAYRDHGNPKARLEHDVENAAGILERLSELGISIETITQQLEDEGVENFNKPFDKLMETLAQGSHGIWRESHESKSFCRKAG
jgi:transaldolase